MDLPDGQAGCLLITVSLWLAAEADEPAGEARWLEAVVTLGPATQAACAEVALLYQ